MFEYLEIVCGATELAATPRILQIRPFVSGYEPWLEKSYDIEFKNWLGKWSWELVSELQWATDAAVTSSFDFTVRFIATFKRQIEEQDV